MILDRLMCGSRGHSESSPPVVTAGELLPAQPHKLLLQIKGDTHEPTLKGSFDANI